MCEGVVGTEVLGCGWRGGGADYQPYHSTNQPPHTTSPPLDPTPPPHLLRPLWVEFPKDRNTFDTDDEFLVGELHTYMYSAIHPI